MKKMSAVFAALLLLVVVPATADAAKKRTGTGTTSLASKSKQNCVPAGNMRQDQRAATGTPRC